MASSAGPFRLRTVLIFTLLALASVLVCGTLVATPVGPGAATPTVSPTGTDGGIIKLAPDPPAKLFADTPTRTAADTPTRTSAAAPTRTTAPVPTRTARGFPKGLPRPLPVEEMPILTASATAPGVIDDIQLYKNLEIVGTKLMDSGKATPMKDLMSQLGRAQCDVKLMKPTGKPLTGAELYDRAKASVVVMAGLYHCPICGRNHCGTASGYFITESGIAVTNYHVLNTPTNLTLLAATADGKIYPVKSVLAASAVSDVAIVQVDGSGFKPLPLMAAAPAGSDVFVLSHPDGRYFTMTRGIVSRYGTVVREKKQTAMLQITAEFAKGSSGGPVLNSAGEVVGMVSSTVSVYYNDDHTRASDFQMVLNQCVPAAQVLELIRPQ